MTQPPGDDSASWRTSWQLDLGRRRCVFAEISHLVVVESIELIV